MSEATAVDGSAMFNTAAGFPAIRISRPIRVVRISQSSRSQPTMIPEASRRSNICSTYAGTRSSYSATRSSLRVSRFRSPRIVEAPKEDDRQRIEGAVKAILAGFPPKK